MLNLLIESDYPEDHDLVCATRWIISAFDHVYLYYNDKEYGEQAIELLRGLLSGWRFTTWINSILNLVY
jgi:hypothetical protein